MEEKKNWLVLDTKTSIIIVLVIVIVGLIGFYTGSSKTWVNNNNLSNDATTNSITKNTEDNTTLANGSKSSNTWETVSTDIVMKVIDDKRCEECYTAEILEQLKMVPELENATIIEQDFTDDWVKAYLETNEIEALPAIIFNSSNIETNIDQFLEEIPSGEYSLLIGSTLNPFAEICDDGIDDTGNWLTDCEDTTCSSKPICRTEEKGKLDVFLMWFCPYWEIAAKAIPSLQDTFWEDLNIDLHYIAEKTWDWTTAEAFDSLHGTTEAEENIRQLCIKKYYWVDMLIDYLQERYANANNYWAVEDEPSVAYTAVNIEATKIDNCVSNWEWAELLEEDIKLAKELWIWASPTWLANNKYTFGGIEASAIQTEFCKYNSELEWCAVEINNSTNTSWDAPSCN